MSENKGDLISRSALKEEFEKVYPLMTNEMGGVVNKSIYDIIDNAPTVEEIEEPFITECRNTAIEKNLPLYFVYYEETGIFEVYETDTKELFEKRHCSKQLSNYEFQEIAKCYLDEYSDWKGGAE